MNESIQFESEVILEFNGEPATDSIRLTWIWNPQLKPWGIENFGISIPPQLLFFLMDHPGQEQSTPYEQLLRSVEIRFLRAEDELESPGLAPVSLELREGRRPVIYFKF